MKYFHVLLRGDAVAHKTQREDVGADYFEIRDGVLVFWQYQEHGEPPTVAIAYGAGYWLTFQEVSE